MPPRVSKGPLCSQTALPTLFVPALASAAPAQAGWFFCTQFSLAQSAPPFAGLARLFTAAAFPGASVRRLSAGPSSYLALVNYSIALVTFQMPLPICLFTFLLSDSARMLTPTRQGTDLFVSEEISRT